MDEGSGGVPLKRECSRKGSELVRGKNPLGRLSRWMDEGRGEVPLKRECSREGSELVSSWKEPTCSLKSLDGRGKGRGTTKKRVFEKTKNKCPKKLLFTKLCKTLQVDVKTNSLKNNRGPKAVCCVRSLVLSWYYVMISTLNPKPMYTWS